MLEAPKSYPEMRKKLLVFNICSFTLLHLLVYADQEKIIENLNFFKTDITNGGKIYFLGSDIQIYFLIPILILAFILDAFQVQKEIETTRRLIDIEYILKPLAEKTNFTLDKKHLKVLKQKKYRQKLLDKVFYEYVGSMNLKISQFRVLNAHDALFWMWFCLENAIVYLSISGLLVRLGICSISFIYIFSIAILLFSGFLYFRYVRVKYTAKKEIEEILKIKRANILNKIKKDFKDFFSEEAKK